MRLGRNLVAGIANSVCSAVVGLAVVPFYLKYLGVEAYGLIGFYTTALMLLSLLDLGLAATINREVARSVETESLADIRGLLQTLYPVYFGTAVLIALIGFLISPLIAEYWLQSKKFNSDILKNILTMMILVVACRWPIGLYLGALMGMQRIVLASAINMLVVVVGSVGGVFVLAFVSADIEAFFLWQACVAVLYVLLIRRCAWRLIGRDEKNQFSFDRLKKIWRFSIGMSGVAVTGVILIQLDKIVLSRMLTLEEFGHYTLAGVLASGLYVVLTPVFNAIYPRMSAMVVSGDIQRLTIFYKVGTRLFLAVLLPIATTAIIFSKEIVYLWTGDKAISESSAPIVSVMLVGTTLNGIMHFPYALQLAYGETRLPFIINCVLLATMLPLLYLLTARFGAFGGGVAWAALNTIYVLVGTLVTHKYLLRGVGLKWLSIDVALPLVVTSVISGCGCYFVQAQTDSIFLRLAFGVMLGMLSFFAIVALSPELKRIAIRVLNSLIFNQNLIKK